MSMYKHLKSYNKRDIQILKYCFPPSLIMKKPLPMHT